MPFPLHAPHAVRPIDRSQTDQLIEVWEAAVRATHDFLTDGDIAALRPLVQDGVFALTHVRGAHDDEQRLVAFLGVEGTKLEALFVHPDWHGRGLGRQLVRHAVDELGIETVDVNEQNTRAVAFYLHLGFQVEGRSEVDSLGKPFPLLHLRLVDPSRVHAVDGRSRR